MKQAVLVFLFFLAAHGIVIAETLPFRSGEILSAELSTVKPEIQNEDPLAFPLAFEHRIYAELTVKIAQGRGISIHDYTLAAFGVTYPCIALRAGENAFDANEWQVRRADTSTTYTLLFVLDATLVGLMPEQILTLQPQFPPKERANLQVPFVNRKEQGFSAPHEIPESGNMKVSLP